MAPTFRPDVLPSALDIDLARPCFIRFRIPIILSPGFSHALTHNMISESSMPVTVAQDDSIAQALSQVAAESSKFMNDEDEAHERLVASARQLP